MTLPLYKQDGWRPSSIPFLEFSLAVQIIVYIWSTYLDLRQRKCLKAAEPSKVLLDSLDRVDEQRKKAADGTIHKPLREQITAKYQASQLYNLDKSTYGFFSGILNEGVDLAMLICGAQPWFWVQAVTLGKTWNWSVETDMIKISLIFVALTSVFGIVWKLPFALYETFVLEQKHGFNKQTLGLFIVDQIKSLALGFAIGGPVISALLWLIDWGGELFYLYVWAFLLVFGLFFLTIYPVLIMPLFNKYESLEQGSLREGIEALARRVSYPLKKLFVVDGSKRSAHSNAYMFGFGKNKRIVLFDTLIKQMDEDEIVSVLGHELGHWKMSHVVKGFIMGQIHTFLIFFCYGATAHHSSDLLSSFGFSAKPPQAQLLCLMLYMQAMLTPFDTFLTWGLNWNTRRHEFQADKFAVDLGYASELQTGLCKMSLENLSNMNPDWLYSMYHYSHPPLAERLGAITAAALSKGKKE